MGLAVFARAAAAHFFKDFVEPAQTLEARSQGDLENGLVGGDQEALCVTESVAGEEGDERGAEGAAKEVHGVVGVEPVGGGDPGGGQGLLVVTCDVTGQLVGSGECGFGTGCCGSSCDVEGQSEQARLDFQAHGSFPGRVAEAEFLFPLGEAEAIGGIGPGFQEERALQQWISEAWGKAHAKEFAQGDGDHVVGAVTFEGDDLVGDRGPEDGQAPGRDGDTASSEQIGQGAGFQPVQFHFAVFVRARHSGRPPEFAGETVGQELGPVDVELLHGA